MDKKVILNLIYKLLPDYIKKIVLIKKIKNYLHGGSVNLKAALYAQTQPIFFIPGRNQENFSRITIITDSVSKGSLFGGVATSIILGLFLANKRNASLRIITRTEKACKSSVGAIIKTNQLPLKKELDFQFIPSGSSKAIEILDNELILTTSWWTTQCIINSGFEKNIAYLLQEDERIFYPSGDEHLKAFLTMRNNNIKFIINSSLLYQHLILDDFDNIKNNGAFFEPAFDNRVFFCKEIVEKKKYNFFFYTRPNHPRNAFLYGMEVINRALQANIINAEKWHFYFVGAHIPTEVLPKNISHNIFDTISWEEYSEVARNTDLALSLMLSAHPSYPPLDIAASGGVVVTNCWGVKKDLKLYSENIICSDIDMDSILLSLKEGVELALNHSKRFENYKNNKIKTDWSDAFGSIDSWLSS